VTTRLLGASDALLLTGVSGTAVAQSTHRAQDVFGAAFVADGLSSAHRDYLAAGGRGFLLGDGALRYRPESIVESYYAVAIGAHVVVTPDAMLIVNPGYNRDRGPAQVYTLRVRVAW